MRENWTSDYVGYTDSPFITYPNGEVFMGFGLLLIGYFITFAMSLSGNSHYLDLVGGILMTYALLKLSDYSEKFKISVMYSLMFVFASVGSAAVSLFSLGEISSVIASAIRMATVLLFHIYVLLALEDMAKGADDNTLARRTRRNLKIVITYFIFYVIISFVQPFFDDVMTVYSEAFLYFYRVFWLILNLILFHSAYARLYIEGTQDKYAELPVYKESRFKFLNDIKRRAYESQKKAYEADAKMMREAREYAAAHRGEYEEKKKKKHRKK